MPETEEVMVPNQKASMSWMGIPAEAAASAAASVRRSSMPLSHSSPNFVQPMPMMATRSRMPLLAMVYSPSLAGRASCRRAPLGTGTGLPEVIVHAERGVDAPERHFDPAADGQIRARSTSVISQR